jgi:hypothetical protein
MSLSIYIFIYIYIYIYIYICIYICIYMYILGAIPAEGAGGLCGALALHPR